MFIKYLTLTFILLLSALQTNINAQESTGIAKEDVIDYEGILVAGGPRDIGRQKFSDDQHRSGLQIAIEDTNGNLNVFVNTWRDFNYYDERKYKNEALQYYENSQWTQGDHIVLIRYPGLGYQDAQGPYWKAVNLSRNNTAILVEPAQYMY